MLLYLLSCQELQIGSRLWLILTYLNVHHYHYALSLLNKLKKKKIPLCEKGLSDLHGSSSFLCPAV